METGWVLEVSTRDLGSYATVSRGATALTLQVDTITDFTSTENGGGSVEINGVAIVYSGYTGSDADGWFLEIPGGLPHDVTEDDYVYVLPRAEQKTALVDFGDGGDGHTAIVDHSLHDRLDDGIRLEDEQEEVAIEIRDDGQRYIFDVIDETPDIEGGYIDPDTLPATGGGEEVPTAPPAASPAVEVSPAPRGLLARALGDPPASSTTLTYEVATDAAFTAIALSVATKQTLVTLGPLPERTDLWVRVVASNVVGAAAPGAAVGPVRTLLIEATDVADLSLTAKKFSTSEHMISAADGGNAVALGANINPGA